VLGLVLTWVGVKSVAWVLPKEIATLANRFQPVDPHPARRRHRDGAGGALSHLAGLARTTRAAAQIELRSDAMTLHPMIAALRKHKSGVVLIAMQIALTLAIVCNAVFIIYSRVEKCESTHRYG
jgi:hypothetical protein